MPRPAAIPAPAPSFRPSSPVRAIRSPGPEPLVSLPASGSQPAGGDYLHLSSPAVENVPNLPGRRVPLCRPAKGSNLLPPLPRSPARVFPPLGHMPTRHPPLRVSRKRGFKILPRRGHRQVDPAQRPPPPPGGTTMVIPPATAPPYAAAFRNSLRILCQAVADVIDGGQPLWKVKPDLRSRG